MIAKTSKRSVGQQLRSARNQYKKFLLCGHYSKAAYVRKWLKAHADLLKSSANG